MSQYFSKNVASLCTFSWKGIIHIRNVCTGKRLSGTVLISTVLYDARAAITFTKPCLTQPLPGCQLCWSPYLKPALRIISPAIEAHPENMQSSHSQQICSPTKAENMLLQFLKHQKRYPAPPFSSERTWTQGSSSTPPMFTMVSAASSFPNHPSADEKVLHPERHAVYC